MAMAKHVMKNHARWLGQHDADEMARTSRCQWRSAQPIATQFNSKAVMAIANLATENHARELGHGDANGGARNKLSRNSTKAGDADGKFGNEKSRT